MRRLVIIGAGGHGAVVAEAAVRAGEWSAIVFIDDAYPERHNLLGWEIIGKVASLQDFVDARSDVHVAIGNNRDRLRLQNTVKELGVQVVTIIDPSAVVSTSAALGLGSVVLANAVINARCRLGDAVIINTAATVDHDCTLADGVHVSPGAHLAGNVTVGARSWVGIGVTVKENILIEEDVVVGASAAVTRNVVAGQTVVGVPARPLER